MTEDSVAKCAWGKWWPLTRNTSNPAPAARVGHTAHAVRSNPTESQPSIIVLGGANPAVTLNEALVYDVVRDSWTQIQFPEAAANGPGLARYEHSSVWLPDDERIFVFGGATQSGPLGDLLHLRFSPCTNQSNACLTLTPHSDTPLAQFEYEARTQRSSTCLTEYEQLLVFAGGALGCQPVSDTRVHMYDIRKNRWFVVETDGVNPCARFGHVMLYDAPSAFTHPDTDCRIPRGRLIIHGGMVENKFFDDFYQLQLTMTKDGRPAGTWQLLSAQTLVSSVNQEPSSDKTLWTRADVLCHHGRMPSARAAHGGALLPPIGQTNNSTAGVLIFGGVSSEGALNDMYHFDTGTSQWTEITLHQSVPKPRLDFACCIYTHTLRAGPEGEETNAQTRRHYFFIHGGMDTEGNLFDDAWVILLAEEQLDCPGPDMQSPGSLETHTLVRTA